MPFSVVEGSPQGPSPKRKAKPFSSLFGASQTKAGQLGGGLNGGWELCFLKGVLPLLLGALPLPCSLPTPPFSSLRHASVQTKTCFCRATVWLPWQPKQEPCLLAAPLGGGGKGLAMSGVTCVGCCLACHCFLCPPVSPRTHQEQEVLRTSGCVPCWRGGPEEPRLPPPGPLVVIRLALKHGRCPEKCSSFC